MTISLIFDYKFHNWFYRAVVNNLFSPALRGAGWIMDQGYHGYLGIYGYMDISWMYGYMDILWINGYFQINEYYIHMDLWIYL